MTLLLALAADNVPTGRDLGVVARYVAFAGLVAPNRPMDLLAGDTNLPVGASAGLSAILASMAPTRWGLHPWFVIPFTRPFSIGPGSINHPLVAGLCLNPVIVALATWEIFAGLTPAITGGSPIRPLGEAFQVFGTGEVLGFGLAGALLSNSGCDRGSPDSPSVMRCAASWGCRAV